MQPLQPKKVFVPTSTDEQPLSDGAVVMLKDNQLLITTYDKGIGFGLSGGKRQWLKEQSLFCFSKMELEVLLAATYSEAAWQEQEGYHARNGEGIMKEQFINNLFESESLKSKS